MSQVRGRIKTVVDYDDRLTVIGTCCESDGTKTTKTLSQCSQDKGRWVPVENPDDVTCPTVSDRGCCCACAYTTKNTGTPDDWTHPNHAEAVLGGRKGSTDGIRNNVTKCECEYYEGNWNAGDCPENPLEILSQCATEGVEGRDDVRWPFACCHCEYDANDEVYRECSNVCLSRDCAALGEGYEGTGFNCTPEFDRFEICDYETAFGGLPKECPEVREAVPGCTNPACDNYDPEATVDDGSCNEPCGEPPPPPLEVGACCRTGTPCTDGISESNCISVGGEWQGAGSNCSSNPCGDDDNGGGGGPGPPPPPTTEPPPPPPPPETCSSSGSSYSIAIDLPSNGYPDWDTDTVFRPTNNDGSVNIDGPEIHQPFSSVGVSSRSPWWWGGWGTCSSYGCGRYCNGHGPYGSGGYSQAWSYGFSEKKKTLGIDKANECLTICDLGPGPAGSDQRIKWDFATKKLELPNSFYLNAIGGDTGEIFDEDGLNTGEIGVKWGCKRNQKHPFSCNKAGFDPYIQASYVSNLRDVELEDPDDPDSDVIPVGETLDQYIIPRSEDTIKALWDEYFNEGTVADPSQSPFLNVSFDDAQNGTYDGVPGALPPQYVQMLDAPNTTDPASPAYYDPFTAPPDAFSPNTRIFKSELIKQFDFGSADIDTNLTTTSDIYPSDFGTSSINPDPAKLIYGSGRVDCDAVEGNEESYQPADWIDAFCDTPPYTLKTFSTVTHHQLLVVDPLDNDGVRRPVDAKTGRCFKVCMEADTPINLKEYEAPTGSLTRIPNWRGWFGWQTDTFDECNQPWDESGAFELTQNPDIPVYARSYDEAKSKCDVIGQGTLTEPGQWPPATVNDFWYEERTGYGFGWSVCMNEDEFCSYDPSDWYYSCRRRYWEDRLAYWRSYTLPTASLLVRNINEPDPDDWTVGQGVWSGYRAYHEVRKFIAGDPAECNPDAPDGYKNCVYDGGWWWYHCGGGNDSRNLDRPSGYFFTEGPKGACLDNVSAYYSYYWGWYRCNRPHYPYRWCCRSEICNEASCGTGLLPQDSFTEPQQPEQPRNPFLYLDPSDVGIVIENATDASACCVLRNGVFNCEYKSRKDCEMQNGFYNVPDDDGPITCSSTLCQSAPVVKKSGFVLPPKIKSANLPEPGTLFAGGVYIGTFTPGVSQVLSNIETGSSTRIKTSTKQGPGEGKRKWALILSPNDLGMEFGLDSMMYRYLSPSESIPKNQTSLYDGLFNTYGNDENARKPRTNLLDQIRNYNLFSFKDWYLPSVEELGFVGVQQKDLDFGVNLNRYSQNQAKLQSNVPYMSSSRKMTKKVKLGTKDFSRYPSANFIYSVLLGNALGPMNGYTVLSGLDNTLRVRLVRRIYVED